MKRLLLVTYHVPPAVGSGVQRMLSLTKHLPEFDWEVQVLSLSTNVFDQAGVSRLDELPETAPVIRVPALDAAKQLSLWGRYPLSLALPDRWASWALSGVMTGMRQIKRLRPHAIASSYPLASAHLLAARLQSRSKLPWLADFRDPMCQDEYPANPRVWRSFMTVEQRTFAQASALSFTSPSAISYYRDRYPQRSSNDFALIHNGYDESLFADLERKPRSTLDKAPIELLHSGLLYPWERNPLPLFAAIAALRDQGFWDRYPTRLNLRASGHEDRYRPLLSQYGITGLVNLCPPLPYRDALAEIYQADGLLLMQAANSNFQIPAKTYEYLRSGNPILGLLDAAGDTSATLREAGINRIADIQSKDEICVALSQFVEDIAAGRAKGATLEAAEPYSRRQGVEKFAEVLNQITD